MPLEDGWLLQGIVQGYRKKLLRAHPVLDVEHRHTRPQSKVSSKH